MPRAPLGPSAASVPDGERALDPEAVAAAQAGAVPEDTIESISGSLRALGEPNRLRIAVALLGAVRLSVRDLAIVTGISEPAASQHLRVLRAERIVRNQRDGRVVLYSLADEHVRDWVELALAHAAHD